MAGELDFRSEEKNDKIGAMAWDFFLYLLYGLSFFTLGVAILSRDIRISELGIARIIWLLALFGIVHGFHEWLALLARLDPTVLGTAFLRFRLAVVSLSFLFLLYFGIFLNIITFYGDQALQSTPRAVKALIGATALSLILTAFFFDLDSGQDLNTRLFIAFPGGILSGTGLIMYSRTVLPLSRKVSINFIFAGLFMISYAVMSGLIPTDMVVPVLGVKIILFRGLSGCFIMFFTIRALSVFNLEQRELLNERLLRFSQTEKLTSMGILAAGIAHEINNPLANVSLNLEMLKDLVNSTDERVMKKIETMERNMARATAIASELLHFSRDQQTENRPLDLNQIIASACTLLQHQPLSAIISFRSQELPMIKGISWKLEEVFINLLMNSLDACTEQDSIEIETFVDGEWVKATITDTGHGIREDDLFKVFDPFYTTKEVGRGTGLGLSVCYNIVGQHGGEISLTSSELEGTRVTLSFPVLTNEQ